MKKFFIILAKIFLIILEIIIHILGTLGAIFIIFNIIRGWQVNNYLILFGGGNMKIFPIWLKVLIVIAELIIHASAMFMIMLIAYCIKTNPDFRITNTRRHDYKIDYTVKSNLYNLKDLTNEIIPIVTKYQKNPRLGEINYHFEHTPDRYISLYFYQKNYKDTKKAYFINVEVNIDNKKITEITKTTGEGANYEDLSNDEFIKPLEKDLTSMLNDYSNKNATLEINNSGIWIVNYDPKYSRQHISFD